MFFVKDFCVQDDIFITLEGIEKQCDIKQANFITLQIMGISMHISLSYEIMVYLFLFFVITNIPKHGDELKKK